MNKGLLSSWDAHRDLTELCSTELLRLVMSDCGESPWIDLVCAPNLWDHLSNTSDLLRRHRAVPTFSLAALPHLPHTLLEYRSSKCTSCNNDHCLLQEKQEEFTFFLAFSSLACAFICWISMESTFLLLINRSWFPMHNWKIWIGKAKQMGF